MIFGITAISDKYYYRVNHIDYDECGTPRYYDTTHTPAEIEEHFNTAFIARELQAGTLHKVFISQPFIVSASTEAEALKKIKQSHPDFVKFEIKEVK